MSKILYAAGTMDHINSFHLPYIAELRREGHEVLTMAKGKDADFDISFEKKMVSFKNMACHRKIRKILKREKFDVLILNTTLAAFNIRFCLPRRNRPKVINFVHGYMFPPKPETTRDKIFFFCEKLLRKKTDYVLVMNADDYKIATENKLCTEQVIMTLGMGAKVADDTTMPVELIRKYHYGTDKYVICFVGELYRAKNQRMLICALPEIQIKIPNAILWLVGEGTDRNELVALSEQLNLGNSVCFLGRRENPCDYIYASDLYVSASQKEGLPFNIMEALGCGRTVLASNIKGHRDIIEDGKSGFLYQNGDINEFVKLVCAAYEGEKKIDPECAKARYREFSFDNVFPKTYGILKELVGK